MGWHYWVILVPGGIWESRLLPCYGLVLLYILGTRHEALAWPCLKVACLHLPAYRWLERSHEVPTTCKGGWEM